MINSITQSKYIQRRIVYSTVHEAFKLQFKQTPCDKVEETQIRFALPEFPLSLFHNALSPISFRHSQTIIHSHFPSLLAPGTCSRPLRGTFLL